MCHVEDPRSFSISSLDIENQKLGQDYNDPASEHSSSSNVKRIVKSVAKVVAFLLYNVYIVYAIYHHKSNALVLDWCGGLGFLLLLTGLVYLVLFYKYVVARLAARWRCKVKLPDPVKRAWNHRYTQMGQCAVILLAIAVFLIVDTKDDRYRKFLSPTIYHFIIFRIRRIFTAHSIYEKENVFYVLIFKSYLP